MRSMGNPSLLNAGSKSSMVSMLSTALNLLSGSESLLVSFDPFKLTEDQTVKTKARCGWYMVEVLPKTSTSSSVLYLNNDSFLSVPTKGSVKRLLFAEAPPTFKLESIDKACSASALVKLIPVTEGFAKQRMLNKLSKKIANGFSNKRSSTTVQSLYGIYQSLFSTSSHISYDAWIKNVEPTNWSGLIENFSLKFSIITPVYNTNASFLKECVESVKAQTYQNWELVLVDDASSNAETIKTLESYKSDPNIFVIKNKENLHISKATNVGLEAATGNYVVFLDHDDLLSPNALNEIALVIKEKPELKFIYSDEDFIDQNGGREKAHFKPDFNLDLLRSHNYITHVCCYKLDLLTSLGGFTCGLDGAQDYDLALRASEALTAPEIYHVPKVLYHWRKHESSTALDSKAKEYSSKAGLRALQAHYSRLNLKTRVVTVSRDNYFRTQWPVIGDDKVSIIIPTKNHASLLESCINSIQSTVNCDRVEFIIIDNNSTEESARSYFNRLAAKKNFRVVRDNGDFNYSRLMNLGVTKASFDYVLMLNNDVEAIEEGWLDEMLSLASRKDIGVVGAKLLYPDQTIQHAGVILGLGGYAAHSHRGIYKDSVGYFNRPQVCQNVSAVTGACMMVRKSVYNDVGGFDESFAVAYNDVDFCLRVLESGFNNIYTPYASLIHYESKTRGSDSSSIQINRFKREKELLKKRWQSYIDHDPAYNPNLTKRSECFGL